MSEHLSIGVEMTHDAYLKSEGVSRSMLKDIWPTPLHYWCKHVAKQIVDEPTEAMQFGTLVHASVLTHGESSEMWHVKPEGMTFSTKEGKAWRSEHQDKPIISPEWSAHIGGITQAVRRHPMARRILEKSDFERSLFVEDEGLRLKCRIDALPRGGNAIFDLKTIERADLESVEKQIAKLEYYKQAGFYERVCKLAGTERPVFLLCFVEKTPPYAVALYQLSEDVMTAGRMTVSRDLQCLRNCIENNEWPGYGNGVLAAGFPAYFQKQLENQL